MSREQEKALVDMMEELKKQLEPYKKLDSDYYLKTLGEIDKLIRRYLNLNDL